MGCDVDDLLLHDNPIAYEEIEKKIRNADLIYVGGGNTLHMLEVWRERGVDKLLIEAHNQGTVLSGISAGAICWFEYGHSDSLRTGEEREFDFIRIEALGILKGIHCPHFNEELRSQDFPRMIKGTNLVGIALEDHSAMIFEDQSYRVMTTRKDAHAYRIMNRDGDLLQEKLDHTNLVRPLEELYCQNIR